MKAVLGSLSKSVLIGISVTSVFAIDDVSVVFIILVFLLVGAEYQLWLFDGIWQEEVTFCSATAARSFANCTQMVDSEPSAMDMLATRRSLV